MKLYKTIHSYDVVAEYIKVCHELGMKLYYWDPIFDTSLYSHNYPGTDAYARFGEWPMRDMSIRTEHHVKHKMADLRPMQELPSPITELHLNFGNDADITAANLIIHTAERNGQFRRYDRPFSVESKGRKTIVRGLSISEPIIKLSGDFNALTDTNSSDAVRAFHKDGKPVELFVSCEITLSGDKDRIRTLGGCAGYSAYWGDGSIWTGPKGTGRTLIVRFGDFERYAIGFPEYAFRENRERMERIVSELYERYPNLDGIAFSIRSHSLPCGGNPEELGGGRIFYGFSDPVVKEFKQRYGIDPRTQSYDENAFLKLRGEFFTQMLEGVSQIVHKKGGKLEVMAAVHTTVGPYNHGSMYPWWEQTSIDNFFDIAAWAHKGFVDNVIMLGTGHRQSNWTPQWQAEVKAFKAKLAGTPTRLTLHYLSNGAKNEEISKLLPKVLEEKEIDEIEFYEENDSWATGKYPVIKKALEESSRSIEQ